MGRKYPIGHDPRRGFMHCEEELLRHTSRYYPYAERFLSELAGEPGFSMAGYSAARLSSRQRELLQGLLRERPSRKTGRWIIQIISSVIAGDQGVDELLWVRYRTGSAQCAPSPKRWRRGSSLPEVSPVEPFQNLALRLGMPVEVRGKEVRVPFRILVRHLDSPNPTIRRNLEEAVLYLHDGGYRLANNAQRPVKRIDWGRHHTRLLLPLLLRRLVWRFFHYPTEEHRRAA